MFLYIYIHTHFVAEYPGHVFTVCIRTENQNQASFSRFGPHEISVLIEFKRLSYGRVL